MAPHTCPAGRRHTPPRRAQVAVASWFCCQTVSTNQRLLSFWHQSQGPREVNKYTHISFRLQPKSEHFWGLTPPNRQKAGEVEDRRHPLALQHAERPLNRWSAHSGTPKSGWNRKPNVLRMVPGRVSFWRPRPPKKNSIFRPRLSASPVKKTSRGRKMTPFLGARKRPRFWNRKTRKVGPTKSQKTTTLRFSFVALIDTMTLRQRAKYPANQTQQMSPFRRTELPKTNRHLCLGTPIHDIRQAKPSGLPGSRN